MTDLEAQFGAIDIYLFDQLLRGRITKGDRIVDAGCGTGRNLVYFLREGFDVRGIDADPDPIEDVRRMARAIAPSVSEDRFRAESLQSSSLPDGCATVVISSAVLHFARTDDEFAAMLQGTWRLRRRGRHAVLPARIDDRHRAARASARGRALRTGISCRTAPRGIWSTKRG